MAVRWVDHYVVEKIVVKTGLTMCEACGSIKGLRRRPAKKVKR